jgi:hypothetical protein
MAAPPASLPADSAPNWPLAPSPVKVPAAPAPPDGFDSLSVCDFPAIFAEFPRKSFKLLWRGSRDGFSASQFHGRCDGHANTLTVILDTKGNIFGGFAPVEWESGVWNGNGGAESNLPKADDSGKSFLFTLKNLHNIAPRRFALIPAEKWRALLCDSGADLCFCDTGVSDNCDTPTHSDTSLGDTYTNDTGLDEETVFTGSGNFQGTEIEVFEITGQTSLPHNTYWPLSWKYENEKIGTKSHNRRINGCFPLFHFFSEKRSSSLNC